MRAEELHSQRLEETSHFNHMVNSWDFELLLMELRRNPVLEGLDTREKIYLLDRIASA
ncbi:hypothetical protein KDL29_04555 [bacterium]|nr:hypothetical protein [bacterium]MCB1219216.1 hypothetical protein [bacterium]UNM09569.1 MAG: hypothetical protein H7A35_05780 [Planctomycetales bacterium]